VALLAGDPGIGKSTLLSADGSKRKFEGKNVLYISGEESEQQIKLGRSRLTKNLKTIRCS